MEASQHYEYLEQYSRGSIDLTQSAEYNEIAQRLYVNTIKPIPSHVRTGFIFNFLHKQRAASKRTAKKLETVDKQRKTKESSSKITLRVVDTGLVIKVEP